MTGTKVTKDQDGSIILRFVSRKDFLGRFLPDVGIGGFQWNGPPVNVDQEITFLISFIGYKPRFKLKGKVVWRRSRPPMRPDLPEGIGIEFLSSEKEELKTLVKFITAKDPGKLLKSRDDRHESRIRVALSCEYLYNNKLTKEMVSDISSSGIYIETKKTMKIGTKFVFLLFDSSFLRPMAMEGKVVWINVEGKKPGFGVLLLFDSRKHKIEVENYIASLSEPFDDDFDI